MAKRYIPIANHIIMDTRLYPSSLRVLVAMHALKHKSGRLEMTQERLARCAGCSPKTVRQAIGQLQELGYLFTIRQWHYSTALGRVVYASNCYKLRSMDLTAGYTLVPCRLLSAPVTHCAFVVLLRGYRYSGREGRFYASLRHIEKASGLSKATIIRALSQLRRLQLITRLHCIRCNRSHSCNSYYPTDMVWGTGSSQESLLIGGGIIFTQPQISNKITKDSMGREKIYGVAEFDISYKNPDGQTGWQLFFFDGTGVKVSAHEEQILAS